MNYIIHYVTESSKGITRAVYEVKNGKSNADRRWKDLWKLKESKEFIEGFGKVKTVCVPMPITHRRNWIEVEK